LLPDKWSQCEKEELLATSGTKILPSNSQLLCTLDCR
jgi:hypothetical protein